MKREMKYFISLIILLIPISILSYGIYYVFRMTIIENNLIFEICIIATVLAFLIFGMIFVLLLIFFSYITEMIHILSEDDIL